MHQSEVSTAGLELPLKVVQARLGHASIQMTADTYGHLFPRADDGGRACGGGEGVPGGVKIQRHLDVPGECDRRHHHRRLDPAHSPEVRLRISVDRGIGLMFKTRNSLI